MSPRCVYVRGKNINISDYLDIFRTEEKYKRNACNLSELFIDVD